MCAVWKTVNSTTVLPYRRRRSCWRRCHGGPSGTTPSGPGPAAAGTPSVLWTTRGRRERKIRAVRALLPPGCCPRAASDRPGGRWACGCVVPTVRPGRAARPADGSQGKPVCSAEISDHSSKTAGPAMRHSQMCTPTVCWALASGKHGGRPPRGQRRLTARLAPSQCESSLRRDDSGPVCTKNRAHSGAPGASTPVR